MSFVKETFRSTVASLIDFQPEENPAWRNNKLKPLPSTQRMIGDIVEIRKKWESTKDVRYESFEKIKRQLEVKFFYHCNVEEEHGLQSENEIETFLERVEEVESKDKEVFSFEEQETINLRDAYLYLKSESEAESTEYRGLLEESMLRQVNKIILRNLPRNECYTKPGTYCSNPRITQFRGEIYYYQQPVDMQEAVTLLLDRFNSLFTDSISKNDEGDKLQGIFKSVAFLVYELLDLHPFSDGNGRLCRLLCSYVLSTCTPFPSPIYNMHSDSCKQDFVNAIVKTRKSESRHPRELTTMIIESNWASWIHLQKVEDLIPQKVLNNCQQDTLDCRKSYVNLTESCNDNLRASLEHSNSCREQDIYAKHSCIASYA